MKLLIDRVSRGGVKPTSAATPSKFMQFGTRLWEIEINSLESILDLVRKEGRLIIDIDKNGFSITVYDDYRE